MAVMAVTAFAQANQQYFRVEFTVPITGDKIPVGQSNNSVSATMKDEYTFCNPEHDYLDFQAQYPMGFRTSTSNITVNSSLTMSERNTESLISGAYAGWHHSPTPWTGICNVV